MRILIISNFYPPYQRELKAPFCYELRNYLRQKNHDIFVLTGNYGVKQNAEEQRNLKLINRILKYVNYENASAFERFYIDRYNFRITKNIIKKILPDMIFFGNLNGISLSPFFAVESQKIPHLFFFTEFWPEKYILEGKWAEFKRFLKKFLPNVVSGKIDFDPAITTTKFISRKLAEKYTVQRFYHLPPSIQIPASIPDLSAEHFTNLMFCGNLDCNFQLEYLLQNLNEVKQHKIKINFNFFGKIDTSYLLKQKAIIQKYNLEEIIHFHHLTENREEIYQQNAIVIIPPVHDGFDLRLIAEAMAFGKVVILPKNEKFQELISDQKNGFVYNSEKENALARIIFDLYKTPKMILEIGKNAHHKAVKEFVLEQNLEKCENIILTELRRQKENR